MVSIVLLVLAMVVAWRSTIRAVASGPEQAAGEPEALSPLELRAKRDRSGTTVENLSENIQGYYCRIPGGFKSAVRCAEEASREHSLEAFPKLAYQLLDRDTRVTIGPLPKGGIEETSRVAIGQYRHEERGAFIAPNLTPQQTQEVREHELTHAWQFLACTENEPSRIQIWAYRFGRSLGQGPDEEPSEPVLALDGGVQIRRAWYLREYLCRPVEIDPRLAALKRWWAWNHGELLNTEMKARNAFDRGRKGDLPPWSDVSGAWQIWSSYRRQPDVQRILLLRVMQLL